MLRRLFKYVVCGCVCLLALISTSTGILVFLSGIFHHHWANFSGCKVSLTDGEREPVWALGNIC